jgi:hypothetical protein
VSGDLDSAVSASPGPDDGPRPRWGSFWRLSFEFALLFGIALGAKQILAASGPYPNPLWLPVIVLSLQRGLAAGLTAAVIAAVLQHAGGLPPALMIEDMYSYIGRIAAEPIGWACVALLIGHIRSRQIAQTRALESELAERIKHGAAVLRSRAEMLERHIAADAGSSNVDVAEAVIALRQATWDDLPERLKRFVTLMTGAAEFAIYVRDNDTLKLVFQCADEHRPASELVVTSEDPLFAAIVVERRLLSARASADANTLGHRGGLAAPLIDAQAGQCVVGMLRLGGDASDDSTSDRERRVAFTCSELSRLLSRIDLLDRWQAALASEASGQRGNSMDARAAEPTARREVSVR